MASSQSQRLGHGMKDGEADLCPSLDTVLDHEVFCHGSRDLGHVVAIGLLAHPRLAIPANGEAQIFRFHWTVRLGNLSSVGRSHFTVEPPKWQYASAQSGQKVSIDADN